jgi:hypothetical protein
MKLRIAPPAPHRPREGEMSPKEIRAAIDQGVHQYWDDAGQQAVAYNQWKDSGFDGECAQISNGTINDYVYRSVMALVTQSYVDHRVRMDQWG